MSLKLKNIIEIYPFTLGKLLTNEDYIEKEITSVNIIEVPTVAKWMKGGELLFSSGYAFQGNLDIASQIILDLAEKQVAALVIKPGIYLNSVPQQLIDLADSVHLPIIQIPEDMPYSLFMQPILEKLINEQIDLLI
ncbi:MAG: PucR family transcriptional regulator ligand-binding domain-containing protein, partial [Methanobacterium sp.]